MTRKCRTQHDLWLEKLTCAESLIPRMLEDKSRWRSLRIDYEKPHVNRLFTDITSEEAAKLPDLAGHRIMLHEIESCKSEEALQHPHPWPSAVRVINTFTPYEMGVGHDLIDEFMGDATGNVGWGAVMTICGEFRYTMADEDGYHYVRPIRDCAYSVMLTGQPWKLGNASAWRAFLNRRDDPQPKLSPLSPEKFDELFAFWVNQYGLEPRAKESL